MRDRTSTQHDTKPQVYQVIMGHSCVVKWEVNFGLQFCAEYFDYWEMAMMRTKFPGKRV